MMVWLQFIACTPVITLAGAKFSRYGDIIAEKTGVGRIWIGVALMASVTSLPELVVSFTALKMGQPDPRAGQFVRQYYV